MAVDGRQIPDSSFLTDKYDRRKILYHPEVIARLFKTGDTWPVMVNTGFTTYCNHSCVWCSSAYTTRVIPSLKTRDELLVPAWLWIKNMKILADKGTKSLIIAGQGEPLLHPKADEMLNAVADSGLKYMMFTNGERVTAKHYDSFFAAALSIRFSVDAATPEMHKRWHAADRSEGRGSSNFNRVVENIRGLVEEKKRRGATHPDIGVQMICSSLTEEDFDAFAVLFKEVGVDFVVYKALQRTSSAEDDTTISPLDLHESEEHRSQQARSMINQLAEIKEKYEDNSFQIHVKADQIEQAYVKEFNGAERYDRCRAHALVPMMEPDGNVYICVDHGGRPEFVIGNIYQNTIDEIWESDQRKKAIANIDLKTKCPAGCFLDETNVVLHQIENPDPSVHHLLV